MVSASRIQTLLACAKAQESSLILPDGFSVGHIRLVTRLAVCPTDTSWWAGVLTLDVYYCFRTRYGPGKRTGSGTRFFDCNSRGTQEVHVHTCTPFPIQSVWGATLTEVEQI